MHPEYSSAGVNWPLEAVGAAEAYARMARTQEVSAARGRGVSADSLMPGQGVKIGVIDSGIDPDHWEFSGAAIATQTILKDGAGDEPAASQKHASHGTGVASVILAQRGEYPATGVPGSLTVGNFHGIAWGGG